MASELMPMETSTERWETAIVDGNLERLQPAERLELVRRICDATGLTLESQPFQYLRLSGKLVLYARRDATDQLRRVHRVSVAIVSRETTDGVHVVTARATMPDGRTDESTGAVPTKGLQGDALANSLMKAETKAKRRVTLSICGLGMLDESEVESIPGRRWNPWRCLHQFRRRRRQHPRNGKPASRHWQKWRALAGRRESMRPSGWESRAITT